MRTDCAGHNWFETVEDALISEHPGLLVLAPSFAELEPGKRLEMFWLEQDRVVAVSRDITGRWERPVHYSIH